MAKYKAKINDYQLIIKVKLSSKESYNEQALSMFSRTFIRGLLRVKNMKRNMIEYVGPQGITLKKFLAKPIKKSDFFFILEQFAIIKKRLSNEHLNENWIVWDLNWIFYNETTREVQFMYLPYVQIPNGNSMRNLLDTLIYSATTAQETDTNYISRFMCFLHQSNQLDAQKMEDYIKKESPEAVRTLKHHGTGSSGFISDDKVAHYEHYKKKEEDEEATSVLGANLKMMVEDDEEATTVLQEDTDEEATTLLCDNARIEDEEATCLLTKAPVKHYPTLYRVSTQEEIPIIKAVFLIGKREETCGYVIHENDKISRSHAEIVTRAEHYFVMDVGSKNGTFVNDARIPINQEVEVKDGDTVRLANEEFEFRV